MFLMCLHTIHSQAQDTSYVSLEKLLQQVETNYPSIIRYQYSIQSIQAKADGAKAWMPSHFFNRHHAFSLRTFPCSKKKTTP